MMNLREQIYHIVEQLPENRLEDALQVMEMFSSDEFEAEDLWLLSSGTLKQMVDDIEQAPAPVKDWRSHLRAL
jgi:hypothetical protein